jgi:hypothetical protein
MTTIICRFKSEGKTVRKTAILNDTLDELSKSKKNEAFDIYMEDYGEGYWSVLFEEEPGTQYEVEFKFDTENRQRRWNPSRPSRGAAVMQA